ncbi:SOS response-associated peptidase [Mucilaginibacter phyllosphaerae]
MCARFVLSTAEKTILQAYASELVGPFAPNYNIAITDETLVITADEPAIIQPMHFGIVPHHAPALKVDYDSFNSRDDRLLESKIWKPLVEHHKTCLVLTNGFYEWKRIPDGKKVIKEPYMFTLTDRPLFAFAGLWSQWVNPIDKSRYRSFSIITTQSNEIVGEIHEKKRMPVILSKEKEKAWLSKDLSVNSMLELCQPFPDDLMQRVRVSSRINTTNRKDKPNNDEGLIAPENSK